MHVWGFLGWLVWLVVHITGFKNRASALFHWIISFFGRARGERRMTLRQVSDATVAQNVIRDFVVTMDD